MSDSGCKNCTERHADCHSTCSKYKAYKEELAEKKRKYDERTRADKELVEYMYNRSRNRDHSRRTK